MKYLKLFESYEDIDTICQQYNIKNFIINNDNSIDVNGSINLNDTNLSKLPLKFNVVNGNFYCIHNKLTTLEGCTQEVNGVFNCSDNKQINLKGTPRNVGKLFACHGNNIISLEGLPNKINGVFYYNVNSIEVILDQIPKDKLKEFIDIYNDYSPIKGNVVNKMRMDQLFDELEIHNFVYDKLKNIYIII